MAKYGIKITIQNDNDQRMRSLWHWESTDTYPLFFDAKEDAEAYLLEEGGSQKIPFYGTNGETQTMEVQEYR